MIIMRTIITLVLLFTLAACGGRGQKKQAAEQYARTETQTAEELGLDSLDIFVPYDDGYYSYTALGLACLEGDMDKIMALVAKGADRSHCMADEIFEYDALYIAVKQHNPELVKYLIGLGDKVNSYYGDYGVSMLAIACGITDHAIAYDIARQLLDAGANVNGGVDQFDEYSEEGPALPLDRAIETGNAQLLRLLIEKGATFYEPARLWRSDFTIWDQTDGNEEIEKIITEWQLDTNRSIDEGWTGVYSMETGPEADIPQAFEITITRDSCTFMGVGMQRYFLDLCTARDDGDKLPLFWLKDLEGTSHCYHAKLDPLATIIRRDGDYYITSNAILSDDAESGVEYQVEKVKPI